MTGADDKPAGKERADRDPLIARLRHLKAAQLELTLADGTLKKVALAKAGARWAKLLDTLDGYDWHYLEALDDKGAVLARLENDEDVEVDDDDDDLGSGCCPTCGRKSEMATLLKVMQTTQRETRLGFASTIDGFVKVQEQQGNALAHLTETYGQSVKLREGMAAAQESAGNPEFAEMLKLAMLMFAQGKQPTMTAGGK